MLLLYVFIDPKEKLNSIVATVFFLQINLEALLQIDHVGQYGKVTSQK